MGAFRCMELRPIVGNTSFVVRLLAGACWQRWLWSLGAAEGHSQHRIHGLVFLWSLYSIVSNAASSLTTTRYDEGSAWCGPYAARRSHRVLALR